MTLVDDGQAEKIYASLGPATEVSGGSAANTAACLASLGGSVRFIGKVRDDDLGRVFTHDIRAAGVRLRGARRPAGERRPGNRALPDHGHAGRREDHVHQPRHRRPARPRRRRRGRHRGRPGCSTWRATCTARGSPTPRSSGPSTSPRDAGARVALSLSDPAWVGLHRRELDGLLDRVDMLFANEQEACGYGRASTPRPRRGPWPGAARRSRSPAAPSGSVVGDRRRWWSVPAARGAQVVDTTGAGDSYAAGFLYGVVRDREPDRAAPDSGPWPPPRSSATSAPGRCSRWPPWPRTAGLLD